MNVLIFFSGKYPGFSAGAKRVDYYKRGLVEEGCHVDIVSSRPKLVGRLKFYLSLLIGPFLNYFLVLRRYKQFQVLFLYGCGWMTILLFCTLKIFSPIKIVIEVNEKPGAPYGNWFTEISGVKVVNKFFLEKVSFPLVDGFVVISKYLFEYITAFKSERARVVTVPIIVDERSMQRSVGEVQMDKPFILHSGALSDRKDGIVGVFKAFAIASRKLNKKLHFYLTSSVAPKKIRHVIDRIIEENRLEQVVHFIGPLAEDTLLAYQRECSLVIINKHLNEQNIYNFPTKLGEYLALGKPVIATQVGEMASFLQHRVNAFVVPPNDHEAIAHFVEHIVNVPEEANRVGAKGMELTRTVFNFRYQSGNLLRFFQEL